MTYERQLATAIKRQFLVMSIFLVACVTLIGSALAYYNVQRNLLSYANNLDLKVQEQRQKVKKVLAKLNDQLAKNIGKNLEKGSLEPQARTLLTELYAGVASRQHAQYLLVDLDGQLLFNSSNELANTTSILPNYIQTVIRKLQATKPLGTTLQERVTYDMDGQTYYVAFLPYQVEAKILGYSCLAWPSTTFLDTEFSGAYYALSDQYDNVLATNNSALLIKQHKLIPQVKVHHFLLDRQNLYFVRQQMLGEDLALYIYLPAVNWPILIGLMATLVLVWLALTGLETYFIARKIAKSNAKVVTQIVRDLRLIAHGYKYQIKDQSNSEEFNYLVEQINHLIAHQQKLYQEALVLEQEKNVVERRLLEAQFNPHFLYNTLETIRITTYYDVKLAERLILALTALLRYSLDISLASPHLKSDLEIINKFLEINSVRFAEFTYKLSVAPNLHDLPVPKLFLLPLLENCLKYGLKERSDLHVEIRAEGDLAKQTYQFIICSNAAPFKQAVSEILKAQLIAGETYHGLANTYKRLTYMFETVEFSDYQEELAPNLLVTGIKISLKELKAAYQAKAASKLTVAELE